MCKSRILAAALVAGLGSVAHGAQSVGIKFASDELNSSLAPNEVAGVFPQAHWNNEVGASGGPVHVVDSDGGPTPITVSWQSSNVWSSTGNGEENNQFPPGPDRKLMSGYLDDVFNATTINLANLPADPAGYDVYVYALGGIGGRSGTYFLAPGAVQTGVSAVNPQGYLLDGGNLQAGDFMLFQGVHPDPAGHLFIGAQAIIDRAPVNAIELVSLSVPIPEPGTIGLCAVLLVPTARRRRAVTG